MVSSSRNEDASKVTGSIAFFGELLGGGGPFVLRWLVVLVSLVLLLFTYDLVFIFCGQQYDMQVFSQLDILTRRVKSFCYCTTHTVEHTDY